ncbi:mRNA-decapping enzyme subunit 2 [Tulasnella sp. 331]|nr:mRNA-decapping enzyme subunit 2 [Tulasnella sp. 331]
MDPSILSMSSDAPSQASDSPGALTRTKPPLAPPALPTSSFSFKDATMDLILEDLSSRFILNLPDNELASVERVCFQVEQAHWYYEDFIRPENLSLPTMPLRVFSAKLFAACPLLQRWSHRHEEAFDDFLKYKTSVPVCGGILLNRSWDKCVLVKGYKSGSPWGFPRGKINENEPLHECAAREVLEETGYNCRDQMREDISITLLGNDHQLVSLYLVPGVPEDFPFLTRTRKEISKIEWFSLSKLPGYGFHDDDDGRYPNHKGTSQNDKMIRTWGISPFLKQLKNRLFYFQVAFGYVPPNLTPHELRDYKRIQKQAARSAAHQQHGHRGRQPTQEVLQEETAVGGDSAAGDSESTGAEGDEEPELDTDYDHDPINGGENRDVSAHHHHPTEPNRPAASAIDALFKKTGAAAMSNADGYSSPDIAGQPAAARRITKAPKRKPSKNRLSSIQTVTGQQAPLVNGTDGSNDKERAHFTNLLQSLANSTGHGEVEPPGHVVKAGGSGLPTPAESPVATHKSTAPTAFQNGISTDSADGQYPDGVAFESSFNGTATQAPKSMFEFISPFDALSPVVPKNLTPQSKAPVTILRRPIANSTSVSSESLDGRPSPAVWSSSDTSVTTPATAGTSGSENMGDISSFSADELSEAISRHSLVNDLVRSPIPEAPPTLGFSTSNTSSMMARGASNITATQMRMTSPDNMASMTPKARLGSLAPSYTNGDRLPALVHSSSLSRSAPLASTSSAQHMALLDMVATEAEVIALSTCPTPQGLQGGMMLPPMHEGFGWNDMGGAGANGTGGVAAQDALKGDIRGRSLYQSNTSGPPPAPSIPMGYPTNPDFYPSYPMPDNQHTGNFGPPPFPSPFQQPPQPQPPHLQSHRPALPPHLHHPHPLLHPQHNIRIPSASPTPLRLPSQPPSRQDNFESPNLAISNVNGTTESHPNNILYNTTDHTLLQPRKTAPISPPTHMSTVGSRMMDVMHGSGGPATLPGQPTRRPSSFVNGNPTHQGRPAPAMVSPILSRLPRPLSGVGFGNSYPTNAGAIPSEHAPAQVSQPYIGLRSPISPPDPGSFVVQKSQTDRAELLNFLRSASIQAPEKTIPSPPNTASNGSGSSAGPSATKNSKRPSMVFESGLIPANVQFRALAKSAFSGGHSAPNSQPT